MSIVALVPGHGSQKPGMGRDLADAFPAARAVFDAADAALGESLSTLCFEGPADTLTLTHNAQPALFAHGAAVWAVLRERVADDLQAAAGHSLGEFTADHAAGTLSLADAVTLVRRRGALMYETGVTRPGAMAAIVADASFDVDALAADATREAGLVVPANYNSPGQTVISGEVAGVERAMVLAKERGAKLAKRLPVSGAFHSPLMEPAVAGLGEALQHAAFATPQVPVYANVTAEPVRDVATARRLLLEQLTASVQWTRVIERLAADFPSAVFVEMGPGAVLTGLVKRIAPAVQTATCGTVAEVEQLLARTA
jgi:[acyl-carrier-protein] S-malonyltransferase